MFVRSCTTRALCVPCTWGRDLKTGFEKKYRTCPVIGGNRFSYLLKLLFISLNSNIKFRIFRIDNFFRRSGPAPVLYPWPEAMNTEYTVICLLLVLQHKCTIGVRYYTTIIRRIVRFLRVSIRMFAPRKRAALRLRYMHARAHGKAAAPRTRAACAHTGVRMHARRA